VRKAEPAGPTSDGPQGLAALDEEVAVGGDRESDMVMEAAPAAAFEVGEGHLLLEVAVALLDPPASLGDLDDLFDGHPSRQGDQPIAAGVLLIVRPFDQQALLVLGPVLGVTRWSDADAQQGEPRGQVAPASLAPRHRSESRLRQQAR